MLNSMDEFPFPHLEIADFTFLDEINDRQNCCKCKKSRMYYCYTCFLPLDYLKHRIPYVKLPLKVDIIKHPGEVCGKSTAVHAAIIAPEDVTIHTYPFLPEYDNSTTVLIYPCHDSSSLKDFLSKHSDISSSGVKNVYHIERVVFIDSTWRQAFKIFSDPRLQSIPRIELEMHNTKFWRPQLNKPPTYLSTIEAIYYCVREYIEVVRSLDSKVEENNSNDTSTLLKCSLSKLSLDQESNKNFTSHDTNESQKFLNFEHPAESDEAPLKKFCGDSNLDNLLFFFSFFYRKIRRTAAEEGRKLKSYEIQRKSKQTKINKFIYLH